MKAAFVTLTLTRAERANLLVALEDRQEYLVGKLKELEAAEWPDSVAKTMADLASVRAVIRMLVE